MSKVNIVIKGDTTDIQVGGTLYTFTKKIVGQLAYNFRKNSLIEYVKVLTNNDLDVFGTLKLSVKKGLVSNKYFLGEYRIPNGFVAKLKLILKNDFNKVVSDFIAFHNAVDLNYIMGVITKDSSLEGQNQLVADSTEKYDILYAQFDALSKKYKKLKKKKKKK